MAPERLTIPVDGGSLAAILHLPEGERRWPCVVAAHGLLSSKDSDKYVAIGETFSRTGLAVCRFDFRGCGESQGSLAETTVAQRVADLRAVVERMRLHPALNGRVALLGSSLGAYVSLFIHGDQDEVVPPEHARRLYGASLNPRQLEIIPGGNHQLTDASHREHAIRSSLDWIGRYL